MNRAERFVRAAKYILFIELALVILGSLMMYDIQTKRNEIRQMQEELRLAEVEFDSQVTAMYEVLNEVDEELYVLDVVYRIASEYDIEPELILAMMKVESNFDVDCETKGCYGLMQVSEIHNVANILELETNIRTGVSLLAMYNAKSDNLYQALGKYNRGAKGYEEYVKRTGTEVTSYAEKVLEIAKRLKAEE